LAFCAWLAESAFLLTTTSTKISVLLFYRRLTTGTFSRRWKWATWVAIVFTVAYCVTFMFALGFNCKPVDAYWKAFSATYTEDWHCTDTKIINPISGAMSVFSDAYAMILPMMIMRHFDMPTRKKVALNLVFSLGIIGRCILGNVLAWIQGRH